MCGVQEFPPEVEPLADCFKRASAKVGEASNIREALEAEVSHTSCAYSSATSCTQAQEVAQLAVQARENANKAQAKLDEAESEVTAAAIVIDKLRAAIDTLTMASIDQEPPDAKGAAALLVTRELGATTDEDDSDVGEASTLDLLREKETLLRDVMAKRQEGAAKVR